MPNIVEGFINWSVFLHNNIYCQKLFYTLYPFQSRPRVIPVVRHFWVNERDEGSDALALIREDKLGGVFDAVQ